MQKLKKYALYVFNMQKLKLNLRKQDLLSFQTVTQDSHLASEYWGVFFMVLFFLLLDSHCMFLVTLCSHV